MDYSNIAGTALNQIADKGRLVTLVYKTQGEYDPDTDDAPENESNSQSIKMVATNFNKKDIDGSLIKDGDKLALIAPYGLTRAPAVDDQIQDGGETYTIKNVVTIQPGDTVLLYKAQIRK